MAGARRTAASFGRAGLVGGVARVPPRVGCGDGRAWRLPRRRVATRRKRRAAPPHGGSPHVSRTPCGSTLRPFALIDALRPALNCVAGRPGLAQCHLAKVDHAASVSWRRLTSLIVAGPGWRVPWSPGRLTREEL